MIQSWRKPGSVSLLDVTPADIAEDFGVEPDPEQEKLGHGFLLLDTHKKLARQTEEMLSVIKHANLTCVQKEVFTQHMVEGKPLCEVKVKCGETYSLGCLELALQLAIESLSSLLEDNKIKNFIGEDIN